MNEDQFFRILGIDVKNQMMNLVFIMKNIFMTICYRGSIRVIRSLIRVDSLRSAQEGQQPLLFMYIDNSWNFVMSSFTIEQLNRSQDDMGCSTTLVSI